MSTEAVIDKRIPDKWRDYKPCGVPIQGERIIPFKTPLSNQYDNESDRDNGIKLHERFTPMDLLNHLNKKDVKLGMVVDFTNTNRYYDGCREFINRGILYRKIKCVGKEIPDDNVVSRFKTEVCTFLAKNNTSDDVIGVHCTHGLNRAGYVVCRYLIECKGYSPGRAIEAFNRARGHPMERENYLEDLHKKTPKTDVLSHVRNDKQRGQDISFDRFDNPRYLHTSTESFSRHAASDQDRMNRRPVQYSKHQNEYHDLKSHYHNEDRYQPTGSHAQSRDYTPRRFSTRDHRDNNYHNSASNYHNNDNNYHNSGNNYHNPGNNYHNSGNNYHNYDAFHRNYDSGHHNYNNYASYNYDDYRSVRNQEGSYRHDHVTRTRPSSLRDDRSLRERPKPYSHHRTRRY
ncbi:dual specificity phosphatase 11 (RNA RNP complex 1-interacting) [Desmophyllum pertusum]|uniref:Dual specificity phosphatase 11 (RNA RNP complex 1-interacting) n=1 Tax=Desmophyllum pertusum TaxID=174260 RepID=A0A9W9ZQ84_9CNID|nr:dual specificity phosphatase 11 (RNA RNP complex 1-interacting) [Desmophyllum pertusum]